MKKYGKWILVLIAILIIAGIIIYFAFFSNKNSSEPSEASRMSTNIQNSQSTNSTANNTSNEQANVSKEVRSATEGLEKEIASYSTKIMDEDSNRDNNMKISLSKINGTVIKNGDTFSFNDTVGSPTPEEGYEKAGVFVENKLKKDYGGGNCQVSTTLYNAVLEVDGLKVTERHEHTKDVYYVEKGKDAAVAYGELDFKFKNSTGYDIKIYAEMSEDKVKVKLMSI